MNIEKIKLILNTGSRYVSNNEKAQILEYIEYLNSKIDIIENQNIEFVFKIERLNNIINEIEKELQEGSFDVYFCSTNAQKTFKSNEIIIKSLILDKLKELKGEDKE